MTVSVTESENSKEVVISIKGRFDFTCHQEFVKSYQAFPQGEKKYAVDLSRTEYMDSSAMGMLLQLREYASRAARVSLLNGNENVRDILRIAHFDKLFNIEGSTAQV